MGRLLFFLLVLVCAAGCAGAAPSEQSADEAAADAADGDAAAEADRPDGAADTSTDADTTADATADAPASDAPAPFATLPTVTGERMDGSELAGEDVALWFWAPWCPTCNNEAPGVAEVVGGLDADVTVVGVAGRDQLPEMEEFVTRHGLDDFPHVADVDGQIWQRFGVVAQPAWVFIDGETGEAVRVLGALPEAELESRLAELAG